MPTADAAQLKEEGNKAFGAGNYHEADRKYSKAIIADPTNPLLYTNRAMARLKLQLYDTVLPDCLSSIELLPTNMKAYFYIAQAELELGRKNDALRNAEMAYEFCSGFRVGSRKDTGSRGMSEKVIGYDKKWASSLPAVSSLVLRCKKEVWEGKERARLREVAPLLEELVDALEEKRDEELAGLSRESAGISELVRKEMHEEVLHTYREKVVLLRGTWEKGAGEEAKRRDVPDWAIDDITFSIMYDPVTTKTGHSYERSSIKEHLKRSATDPLTREPLTEVELRPNLGLKHACAEFLAENGWAVDW